jgi:REP element-mobilizing transposase RayT
MTQRRIYQTQYPYFVTFNTRRGFCTFDNVTCAKILSDVIFQTCRIKNFQILIYQIMPDHVHMLICNIVPAHPAVGARGGNTGPTAGTAARARFYTISQLVHGIKSYYYTTAYKKFKITLSPFQSRFNSRVVNDSEYLKRIIRYVEYNPIKACLPLHYRHHPYQFINWEAIHRLF